MYRRLPAVWIGCLLCVGTTTLGVAQELPSAYELVRQLKSASTDTAKAMILEKMARHYRESRPDTALALARQGLALATRQQYIRGIAYNQFRIASILRIQGHETESYPLIEQTLPLALSLKDTLLISKVYYALGIHMDDGGKYGKSVYFFHKSLFYSEAAHLYVQAAHASMGVATLHQKMGHMAKAEPFIHKSTRLAVLSGDSSLMGMAIFNLGDFLEQKGNASQALEEYKRALPGLKRYGTAEEQSFVIHGLARLYGQLHQTTESVYYYQQLAHFHYAPSILARDEATQGYFGLAKIAEQEKHFQEALRYMQTGMALKDSIAAVRKRETMMRMQAAADSQGKKQQIKRLRLAKARQQREMNLLGVLLAGACVLLVCLFVIVRQRQQHNRLLNEKNTELSRQNEEITTLYEQMAVQSSFLSDMNEEVTQINQQLEEKILQRTEALEYQNTTLKQYAFMNAHQLRSPIANLLGLGNLLSLSESTEEKEYIYLLISQQIVKLDQAIQEAQKHLNQAEYCVQCEDAKQKEQQVKG